jgi:hyperosmotically inducible protein
MRKRKYSDPLIAFGAWLAMSAAPGLWAATAPNPGVAQDPQATSNPTAQQQGNSQSDLEITRKIRHAVVSDKSLSIGAHNVKIITIQGRVTLKGMVRSDDEKQKIESAATAAVGSGNVDDQIAIAGQ